MKRKVLFLLLLCTFGVASAQDTTWYVVEGGDNPGKIARKNGITEEKLRGLNPGKNLQGNNVKIYPGEKLVIDIKDGNKSTTPSNNESTKGKASEVTGSTMQANSLIKGKDGSQERGRKSGARTAPSNEERGSSSGFLTWLLWIIIISAVGYGCYYWWPNLRDGLFKLRGRPSSFENEMREVSSGEVAALRKRVRELEDEVQRLKSEKRQLDRERKELLEENIQLGEQVEAKNDSQKEKVSQPKPVAEPQRANRIKYAESIMGDTLILVSDIPSPDALFRLELEDGRTAKFELHEPAIRRVVSNPSFLEGCDKQVVGRSKVTVVEPGEARKDENGYWHVTKKLKVVIE